MVSGDPPRQILAESPDRSPGKTDEARFIKLVAEEIKTSPDPPDKGLVGIHGKDRPQEFCFPTRATRGGLKAKRLLAFGT